MKYILPFVLVTAVVLVGAVLFFVQSEPQVQVEEETVSLKDALGQMLIIGFDGTEVTPDLKRLIKDIHPGGVLLLARNLENAEQTKALIEDLQTLSFTETGIPLFIAVDQEGGMVSRVSWIEDTAQYALKDMEEAGRVGERRGKELIDVGINMNLAPVLDSRGRGDFLFFRSFQKRDEEAFVLAQALIESHVRKGVFAVPKHFPGYDGITQNPEKGSIPVVENIPDTLLFEYAVDVIQLDIIMLSHVVYKELDTSPFPLSLKGITFAREKLGNNILLMSDDLLSEAFIGVYGVSDILSKALVAGVDILLIAGYPDTKVVGEAYGSLLKIVEEDKVLQERVQSVAQRIIEIKQKLR